MSGGDNSTGSGGSWSINPTIIVCSDTNTGASQLVADVVSIIKNAGKNATAGGVGPSSEYYAIKGKTNTTMFMMVNGVDHAMAYEFYTEVKNGGWMGTGNNIVIGFHTGHPGACTMKNITDPNLRNAWDAGYATASMRKNMMGTSTGDWLAKATNCGWVAGPDANSLAQAFLSGKGSSGSSSVEVVEGFIESGRGGAKDSSPQFWNHENYEPYEEIQFTNFKVVEEFPRTLTAEFETTENIDLTSGRVAVLIKGDCNPFGGIILSKKYDNKDGLYTYKCQGFMERIMANGIYAVYNGGKNVYNIIKEVLADLGVPDSGLLPLKEYSMAITEELKELMDKDKDLVESSDMFDVNSTKSSSSSSSSEDSSNKSDDEKTTKTTKTDKTKTSEEESDEVNPMKKKPKGIYDKPSIYEFFNTLIYDYGVNIDFYGDINGIPHWDVMDLEDWKNDVWMFSPRRGFESDYDYEFDLTDAVNQVAVKNISATNGTGEIYTAEELIDVPLQDYEGRMGVVVDNPTKSSSATSTDGEYQDSTGKKYTSQQVIITEGQPSCNNCMSKKPTIQKYKKYWYKECPSCEETDTLEFSSVGDGTIHCSECDIDYCVYCGYDRKGQKHHLTELFLVNTSTTDTNTTDNNTTDTTT